MSLPIQQVALPDATRIAQAIVHRDAQTQLLAGTEARRHTTRARELPAAAKGAATRERFRRSGSDGTAPGDAEGEAPVTVRPRPGHLDLLA